MADAQHTHGRNSNTNTGWNQIVLLKKQVQMKRKAAWEEDEVLGVGTNVQFGDSQSQKNTVSGVTAAEEYVLL